MRRADLGQLAHDGALADDLGVAADVGRAGRARGELVDVGQAPASCSSSEILSASETVSTSAGLFSSTRRVMARQMQAMVGAVEVGLGDDVADAVPGRVAQQQAAEHRLLRLHGVRRQAQGLDLGVTGGGAGTAEALGAGGNRGHVRFCLLVEDCTAALPHRKGRSVSRASGGHNGKSL